MGAGEAESWERPRHRRSGKASPPQSRLRDPAAHGHAARIGVDVLPLERLGRLGRKLPRGQHPSPHLVPADTLITVLTNAIVTPNTSLAASCRGDSGHEFNSIRRCCGVGGGGGGVSPEVAAALILCPPMSRSWRSSVHVPFWTPIVRGSLCRPTRQRAGAAPRTLATWSIDGRNESDDC